MSADRAQVLIHAHCALKDPVMKQFHETSRAALRAAPDAKENPLAIRVFLVEDMQRVHALMSELLRGLGNFTLVGTAGTEAEAISWLGQNKGGWDLAVIDLVLDQGSGIGVVSRCRDRADGAKVVVLSEYVTPVIREHCLSLGADAAFLKSEMDEFTAYCGELAAAK
jgi:DNA-binding NarL/FixJ family response regulator